MAEYKLRIVVEGIDKASGPLKNIGGALGDIGKIAAGVSLGNFLTGGVQALGGIAKGALDSYANFERLSQSINALTAKQALLSGQAGTMEQALAQTSKQSQELLGWVQKLAIESPFRQDDVAGAFRLSMALGFNTQEAQRLTQAMLNFSTATGQGGETIERVARALGQMRTRGKVSLEEVNQLTEAGVDAMRILREATGLTGAALTEKISKGAVDANMAINAIIADSERLYAGAGAASATSMAGLLSTLEEMQELTSRNFLSGMFEQLQGPLAAVVSVISAPEFQAGISAWGDKLGSWTGDQLTGAADAIERIDKAITPLLDKQAPGWLVALQGAAALGGTEFKIDIKPKVTSIETPDGGLKLDVTATATTLTTKEGGVFSIDTEAQVVSIKVDETAPTVKLTADWKEGAIGSFIAAAQTESEKEQNKILLNAGWEATSLDTLQTALDATQLWAKINPLFVMAETATGVTLWAGQQAAQMAGAIKAKLSEFSWEQYKADWSTALATWQPALTGLQTAGSSAFAAIQGFFATPIYMKGEWESNTGGTLFGQIQAAFAEPIMMVGGWLEGTLNSLWSNVQGWFNARPVNLTVKPAYSGKPGMTPLGADPNQAYPIDVTPPMPETYIDPVTGEVRNRATGDGFFYGGWAVVGEQGPELLNLPRGTKIYNNTDTERMMGGGIPGFAEGTTTIPPSITRLLGAMGLWVPQGTQQGPKTREEALGWKDFTKQGVQAMQTAADRTGAAFENTAKKLGGAFEAVLSSVPGLFDASAVTGDQMRMAELGVPQNFADDYLRRLTDEVVNGVDWEGVDIQDAAARAGIDPNLPANVILELFRNAWNDSSLFANAANLDLINQDAIKAAIEQQQKELQGQANIKALFGITDDNLQSQIDELGAGLASVFGGAAETDAVKGAGAALFDKVAGGMGDQGVANKAVGSMAGAIQDAAGTVENVLALTSTGATHAAKYYEGWGDYMRTAPVVPPGGPPSVGPALPPTGNALGTPSWRGGWTVAGEYGPELVNLPAGSAIYDAPTTRRMRARAAQPVVVNNTFIVNDRLMAEQAASRAVQKLRRGW